MHSTMYNGTNLYKLHDNKINMYHIFVCFTTAVERLGYRDTSVELRQESELFVDLFVQ